MFTQDGLEANDLVILEAGEVCSIDDACYVDGDGWYLLDDCFYCPITGECALCCDSVTVEGISCDISEDGRGRIATKKDGQYLLDELYSLDHADIIPDNIASLVIEYADSVLAQFEDSDSVDREALEAHLLDYLSDVLAENLQDAA